MISPSQKTNVALENPQCRCNHFLFETGDFPLPRWLTSEYLRSNHVFEEALDYDGLSVYLSVSYRFIPCIYIVYMYMFCTNISIIQYLNLYDKLLRSTSIGRESSNEGWCQEFSLLFVP